MFVRLCELNTFAHLLTKPLLLRLSDSLSFGSNKNVLCELMSFEFYSSRLNLCDGNTDTNISLETISEVVILVG